MAEVDVRETFKGGIGLVLGVFLATACPAIAEQAAQQTSDADDAGRQAALCVTPGDWQAAIAACTWIIQSGRVSGPNLANAYTARAVAYENAGDMANAVRDEEEAIELTPDNELAYEERGYIYGLMGQYSRAIPDLDHAIMLEPNNWRALQKRCLMRAEWGKDLELALADCSKAIEISPTVTSIFCSRGLVYLRLGKYQEAIEGCDTALSQGHPLAFLLYTRGLAKLKAGNADGGNADLAQASALDSAVAGRFAGYGLTP